MKKNSLVLIGLVVSFLFSGCIANEEDIGIHEEAIDTVTFTGTVSPNKFCLHSTYNVTKGWNHWFCDEDRIPVNVTGVTGTVWIQALEGNDILVQRWMNTNEGCPCSCNVDTGVYGSIKDYRGDGSWPGRRVLYGNFSSVGLGCHNPGNDKVYGGLVTTQYDAGDDNDTFRGGLNTDVFNDFNGVGCDNNDSDIIWDPDGEGSYRTGPGNDTIDNVQCKQPPLGGPHMDCGPGAADVSNGCGFEVNCENTASISAPSCPALPFP